MRTSLRWPAFAVGMMAMVLLVPAQQLAAQSDVADAEALIAGEGEPLRVTYDLDVPRAVEAPISAAGGSLSVTSEDGTVFTLDVPAGALAEETLIRMTPVLALDGVPFGEDHGTVYLEPDGLVFDGYVDLTVEPPVDLPVEEQIFIGYEGPEADLVLAPPDADSEDMVIRLWHFSGYGVSKGFLADTAPYRARLGGSAEARISSAVAAELQKARQAQLLGDETATVDLGPYLERWEEEVIKPRLAAAGDSCAAGRLAIETVLGHERQLQLLGMGEGSGFPADLFATVAENCLREEYELCRDEHIVHRMVQAVLGLERQLQLLGTSDGSGPMPGEEYIQKCLSFRLEFHSEVDFDGGRGGRYTSVVDSKVKLVPESSKLGPIRGTAPLVNTRFKFKAAGCNANEHRGGATFTAKSLDWTATTPTALADGPADPGRITDLTLVYDPGNTTESVTVKCPGGGAYQSPQTTFWSAPYLVAHKRDLGPEGLTATEWDVLGGELFARKEWVREAGPAVEAGTFKLYHTPE